MIKFPVHIDFLRSALNERRVRKAHLALVFREYTATFLLGLIRRGETRECEEGRKRDSHLVSQIETYDHRLHERNRTCGGVTQQRATRKRLPSETSRFYLHIRAHVAVSQLSHAGGKGGGQASVIRCSALVD